MIFLVVLAVVCTASSQLLQALAARKLAAEAGPTDDAPFQVVLLRTLKEPRVFLAYVLLGIGLMFWLVALTQIDVSAGYPMFGLGFVLTMLAARFGLGENVGRRAWFGALLIVVGSMIAAWTP